MKRILEVQKQIGTLSKNAKNPFFKSQYLDLTTLIESVVPLLNEQGLLLMQPIKDNQVFSLIVDASEGTAICESSIHLPNITDPQKLGSAITYFRRYTLKSLLAIAEEDDDGNKASKPTSQPKKKLTPEQYKATLKSDAKGIKAVIDKFDLEPEQLVELKAILNDGSK